MTCLCDVFVLQVHTEFTRSRHGPIPAWAEGIKVFNYGGQKLQFSEQQRLLMIDRLAGDSSSHYTYSKDMLSGAFVLCNVADEQRLSKETHKKLMMTADGFQWPVPKGPGEFTKPNFELDAGRKDELGQAWVEGVRFKPLDGGARFVPKVRGGLGFGVQGLGWKFCVV